MEELEYTEALTGRKITDDLVVDFEVDNEGIPYTVSGVNVAEPISSFAKLNLPVQVLKNLKDLKVEIPTTIQKHGIPQIIAERDVMCCSHTGTGKTAAYLLPFLRDFFTPEVGTNRDKSSSGKSKPKILILVPTRELAEQVVDYAKNITKMVPNSPKCMAIFGGDGMGRELEKLKKGNIDLIGATPGRLIHILTEYKCLDLLNVKFLVIDEADEMFNRDFFPQIGQIIKDFMGNRKILGKVNIMLSATFKREIQHYAKKHLKKDHIFISIGLVGGADPHIRQEIILTDEIEKLENINDQLTAEKGNKVLIFCNTIEKVEFIEAALRSYGARSLHSKHSQFERDQILKDFNDGKVNVVVATSVAARGLNIKHVHTVVNYDFPTDINDYVQRIGRARGDKCKADHVGKAISFFDPKLNDTLTQHLIYVLKDAKQDIPEFLKKLECSIKQIEKDKYQDPLGDAGITSAFENLKTPMIVEELDEEFWG